MGRELYICQNDEVMFSYVSSHWVTKAFYEVMTQDVERISSILIDSAKHYVEHEAENQFMCLLQMNMRINLKDYKDSDDSEGIIDDLAIFQDMKQDYDNMREAIGEIEQLQDLIYFQKYSESGEKKITIERSY